VSRAWARRRSRPDFGEQVPSANAILDGLGFIANTWSEAAIAWHVTIAAALVALLCGWRPTERLARLILTLPLASVSALAWAGGNPFNGTVFAAGTFVLAAIGSQRGPMPAHRSSTAASLAAIAMIAFAWIYPHFLEGPAVRYLYAAPVGLIPCPTLAAIVGFALLADGLGSRTWSLVLATMGSFYGLFGLLVLGVRLDIGLAVGAFTLAGVVLSTRPMRRAGVTA
jgi:hypothetical protein